MTRKIKAKANAMEDADVHFISLVSRPASRIPFRLTKSEDDPESEAGFMLNLNRMFKRDGEAPKGVTLVGVVLQRKHAEFLGPKLKELGLKIDDTIENDDVVIMKQTDFNENEVMAIKHGDVGGIYRNLPEQVKKAFDPYTESDDFDENMALSFLPGMSAATEALFDSVIAVLRSAESPDDARTRIESNIDKYKSAVMDMAQGLPEMAFKLEGLTLDGFVEKEEGEEPAPAAEEPAAEEPAAEAPEAEAEAEAPAEEPAAEAAEEPAAESVEKGEDHINEIDEPAEVEGDKVAKSDSSEESEQGDKNEISEVLNAFKSEVLEAISSVKSEVGELKSKQAELTEKVNDTAAIAERARKAVKGTVRSGSDAGDRVRNESLGTRSRKGESKDEATWGGTALDRIVGDFGE
jgi:gas vesicle protein